MCHPPGCSGLLNQGQMPILNELQASPSHILSGRTPLNVSWNKVSSLNRIHTHTHAFIMKTKGDKTKETGIWKEVGLLGVADFTFWPPSVLQQGCKNLWIGAWIRPRACLNGSQSYHSLLKQYYLISVANASSSILIDSENTNSSINNLNVTT